MSIVLGLICGLLFGLGLALSGMTDTSKVVGFLDVFGDWDFSLAFVMASGLLVTIPAYQLIKSKRPLFAKTFSLPTTTDLDKRLVSGSAIFGIGWGVYGYCPGPAVASIAYGQTEPLVFLVMMVLGMYLAELFMRSRTNRIGVDSKGALDDA